MTVVKDNILTLFIIETPTGLRVVKIAGEDPQPPANMKVVVKISETGKNFSQLNQILTRRIKEIVQKKKPIYIANLDYEFY